MVAFSSLFLAASAAAVAVAAPSEQPGMSMIKRQTLTSSATGTHNGYYYSFWTDGQPNVQFSLESGGQYTAKWSGNGNWVGGKGWNPGAENRYCSSGDDILV